MKNVHDGHRERVRDKIRKGGLPSFQQHEVLEYLLFSFIPRKDTNEIAHALIDKFSSFAGVLNASERDLKSVNGMTDNAAFFLSKLPEIMKLYVNDVNSDLVREDLSGRGKARNFLCGQLFGLNQEHVCVAALDAHSRLIKCEIIEQGSGDAVFFSVRKIVDFALSCGASYLLLAHNHPSGNTNPSEADYAMTKELYITLANIGIILQDHIIFGGSQYYSFEEHDELQEIQKLQKHLKEGTFYYV